MKYRKYLNLLLIGLLTAAIVYQGLPLIREYGIPYIKAAWRTRDLTGMEKSARFLLGNEGAEYVKFLNDHVPEDYQIVTPNGVANHLRDQSILQFFFLPRDVLSCACGDTSTVEKYERCFECLKIRNNAIPAIGDFPPINAADLKKIFIPFTGVSDYFHGVYLDRSSEELDLNPESDSQIPILASVILDISLLVFIFLIGILLVTLIVDSPTWWDGLSLSFPIGAGLTTMTVFLLGWTGMSIQLPLIFGVITTWALILLIFNYLRYRTLVPNKILGSLSDNFSEWKSPLQLGFGAIFFLLFLMLIMVSLTRAYSLYDGIANWALKGYAIAEFNTIFAGRDWGGHGLSYPQNIHLLVAFFRLLDRDILPGSKFLFPLFALSLFVGCYTFWRRNTVNTLITTLGVLLVVTVPFLFLHSTIGWSNLIFSCYIVLGSLWIIDGGMKGDERRILIGGVILSFAGWTRVEGGGFALLVLSAIMIALAMVRKWKPAYLLGYLPVILVGGLWVVFGTQYIARDEIGRVLQTVSEVGQSGQINLSSLGLILQFAADKFQRPGTWGVLVYTLPIIILMGLFTISRRKIMLAVPLFAAAITSLAIPIGIFFIASFDKGDFPVFLSVSFDRAMIPGVILLIVLGIVIAAPDPQEIDHHSAL